MWAGTRRLLRLTVPAPRIGGRGALALAGRPGAIEDAVDAAYDALIAEVGGPARDAAAWARLRDHVAGHLSDRVDAVIAQVEQVLAALAEVEARLEPLGAQQYEPARLDVARQLGGLVYPGFVAATGASRLDDLERYLRAAARRLERLPDTVAVDRDRMRAIQELEALYEQRRAAGGPPTAELREARRLLQELRVSQFAQAVGVRGPVSAKRIRRLLAGPGAAAGVSASTRRA
jgi:ATP-dependent helicase HrpA